MAVRKVPTALLLLKMWLLIIIACLKNQRSKTDWTFNYKYRSIMELPVSVQPYWA